VVEVVAVAVAAESFLARPVVEVAAVEAVAVVVK
jgi:hypothetical protein